MSGVTKRAPSLHATIRERATTKLAPFRHRHRRRRRQQDEPAQDEHHPDAHAHLSSKAPQRPRFIHALFVYIMIKDLVDLILQRRRPHAYRRARRDTGSSSSSSSVSQPSQGEDDAWIPPTAVNPPARLKGATEPAVHVLNGELVYAPLATSPGSYDAIRLLRILPGEGDQPLQCSLLHTTLTRAANTYEALSYTWGDATNNEDIRIGDHGARLSVTANCASALRHLRYPDRPTLAWVDAICINQKDVPERNHQLALMGHIYRKSNRVTIYLGEGTEETDEIMDFMSVFTILNMEGRNPFREGAHWSPDPNSQIDFGYAEWCALANLFHRPWFTRVWILQEVFMADIDQAVMVCGDRWVEWSTVLCLKNSIEAEEKAKYGHGRSYGPMEWPFVLSLRHRTWYTVRKDLVKFLHSTRCFGATDPRDRLFALLNLFKDAEEEGLVADYGLTTAQAYEVLARCLIKHDLGVLSAVQGFSDLNGLPSWACDWSQKLKVQPLYPGEYGFDAGGKDCETVPSIVGDHALVLHGILIGEVVPDIGWDYWVPNGADNFDNFSLESTLEQWDAAARSFRYSTPRPLVGNHIEDETEAAVRDQYPISHAMTRAFSHPVWDHGYERAVLRLKRGSAWKRPQRSPSSDPPVPSPGPTDPASQSSSNTTADLFVSQFPAACELHKARTVGFHANKGLVRWKNGTTAALQGRVFLGTKNGYYGLAPAHIRAKDIICVFPGAPVPYALRPVGDNFMLVGECFVQGIMHGEALKSAGWRDATSKNDTEAQFESRSFTIV